MSEFTKGKWDYLNKPISFGENSEAWYLVGSPKRAIGFIRHKEDARLIAAAPDMYALLYELFNDEYISHHDVEAIREKWKSILARIDGVEPQS